MPYILGQDGRDQWDNFCFYEGVFSPEECDRLIEQGKALPPLAAVISVDAVQNHEKRKTTVGWMEWNSESDWVFKKLEAVLMNANRGRYRFNLSGFLEPLQFTQYLEPDDHYDWHQDSGAGKFSIRKLSMVVQLSDPDSYEGGDLEFFLVKREPVRSRGTVFVFPSFEAHRVTPLLSGKRYSLVSWVSGPPFA